MVLLILTAALPNCKRAEHQSTRAYTNLYMEYTKCIAESGHEVVDLDQILKLLSQEDADTIRKTIIEFNNGDGEWIARFSINGENLEMNKDGSVWPMKRGYKGSD